MTARIDDGAKVRLTRDADGHRTGFEFTVDEYLEPYPESEREPDDIDVPHYYGSANGGSGNVFVPADAVEVVMSAGAMRARRIPNLTELRDGLASEITGSSLGYDDAEIDETVHVGDREIEGYGTTADGLGFGFRLRVVNVWETDL